MPKLQSRLTMFAALYFLSWTKKQSKKMAPEHLALIREVVRKEIGRRIPNPQKYPELYDYLMNAFESRGAK